MNLESTRTRNPERTKLAVLDAAEQLFAERGFVGTSMRDIADASGVSQPLIQYHFNHKDGLYEAALRRAVEAYAARFPEAARVADQPADLRTELKRIFSFMQENPLQTRLVGWARLENKSELVTGCEMLRRAMVGRLQRAQEQGLVRRDVDATAMTVMLEGLIFYWFENRSLNAQIIPADLDDDTYLEQTIAIVERGFGTGAGKGA